MKPALAPDPEFLLTAIEAFLATCRRPAALEYGENPLPLTAGGYALEIRSGRLSIEIWEEARSVSRRILSIERHSTGLLDCTIQKFGGVPGRLTFLDLDRPQTQHRTRMGQKQSFGEQFRRMLQRQFPGWEIDALSAALDLRHSFSSIFPRALVTRGSQQLAASACPDVRDESALLTFALVWHRYLQVRRRTPGHTGLCLFLPEGAGNLTAHRLRWLTGEPLNARLFRFNAHGSAGEVDPHDLGNLDTRVASLYVPPRFTPQLHALLAELKKIDGITFLPEMSGDTSIRSRGLEFARFEDGRILLGIESQAELPLSHQADLLNYAVRLSQLSAAPKASVKSAGKPAGYPERWFEAVLRAHLSLLDPALLPEPVHGQVLSFAAADRGLIDLLAATSAGRLAVLELKVAEDPQLPLQALDYWMRVAWHLERDELGHLFPGVALENKPPKLILLAPAMAFHSTISDLLRYFSPLIDVERVGVNSDWGTNLRVVLRLTGAALPISHRGVQ